MRQVWQLAHGKFLHLVRATPHAAASAAPQLAAAGWATADRASRQQSVVALLEVIITMLSSPSSSALMDTYPQPGGNLYAVARREFVERPAAELFNFILNIDKDPKVDKRNYS